MCHSTCQASPAAIPLSAEQHAALLPCSHLLCQLAQRFVDFAGQPITPAATQQLETAQRLYAFAAQWRRVPHVTFLIQDDFVTSVERAQCRLAYTYKPEELALLRKENARLQARLVGRALVQCESGSTRWGPQR